MSIKKANTCINLFVIGIILVAIFSVSLLVNFSQSLLIAEERRTDVLALAEELRQSSKSLTSNVRMYAVTGDKAYKDTYFSIVEERSGQKPRPASSKLYPNEKHDLVELIRQHGVSERELAYVQEASRLSNALIPLEEEAMRLVEGVYPDEKGDFTVTGAPDREKAMGLVFGREYMAFVAPIMEQLDTFVRLIDENQSALVEAEIRKEHFIRNVTYICLVLTLLAALFSMWYSTLQVAKPIGRTMDFAQNIAAGKLDTQIPVTSKNEIGQLNQALCDMVHALQAKIQESENQAQRASKMGLEAHEAMEEAKRAHAADCAKQENILAVAKQLEGIVEVVSTTSTELTVQVEQSERGAVLASSHLTETATAMEEMNATVLEVARNAGTAASASDSARQKAQEGAIMVENIVKCMADVENNSTQLLTDMENLGHQAKAIGSIMDVISDIADQTNMLALNAAIEAARAGEAGRGFAVVADEVRKLAEKTMQATVEVGNAINGIQNSADKNRHSVDASGQSISQATNLVQEAGNALQEIVFMVTATADQVRAIATAAEEQSATSESINRSLATVSNAASETAIAMATSAQAVDNLSRESQKIMGLIEQMLKKENTV